MNATVPIRGTYKTYNGNRTFVVSVRQIAENWILYGGIEDPASGIIAMATWDVGGRFYGPNPDVWSINPKSRKSEHEATH